jgi:hypothetical protein
MQALFTISTVLAEDRDARIHEDRWRRLFEDLDAQAKVPPSPAAQTSTDKQNRVVLEVPAITTLPETSSPPLPTPNTSSTAAVIPDGNESAALGGANNIPPTGATNGIEASGHGGDNAAEGAEDREGDGEAVGSRERVAGAEVGSGEGAGDGDGDGTGVPATNVIWRTALVLHNRGRQRAASH